MLESMNIGFKTAYEVIHKYSKTIAKAHKEYKA